MAKLSPCRRPLPVCPSKNDIAVAAAASEKSKDDTYKPRSQLSSLVEQHVSDPPIGRLKHFWWATTFVPKTDDPSDAAGLIVGTAGRLLATGTLDKCKLFHVMVEELPTINDKLAKAMLLVLDAAGATLPFLQQLIQNELMQTTRAQQLFRGNSNASRILSTFFRSSGKEFLHSTLAPTIEALLNDAPLEVDVQHQAMSKDQVEANVRNILNTCQGTIDMVIQNGAKFPPVLKAICHIMHESISDRFPGYGLTITGSFIFLRFFCPAMLSTKGFGLVDRDLSDHLRTMVIISKILQAVANGATSPPYLGLHQEAEDMCKEFLQLNIASVRQWVELMCTSKPTEKDINKAGVYIVELPYALWCCKACNLVNRNHRNKCRHCQEVRLTPVNKKKTRQSALEEAANLVGRASKTHISLLRPRLTTVRLEETLSFSALDKLLGTADDFSTSFTGSDAPAICDRLEQDLLGWNLIVMLKLLDLETEHAKETAYSATLIACSRGCGLQLINCITADALSSFATPEEMLDGLAPSSGKWSHVLHDYMRITCHQHPRRLLAKMLKSLQQLESFETNDVLPVLSQSLKDFFDRLTKNGRSCSSTTKKVLQDLKRMADEYFPGTGDEAVHVFVAHTITAALEDPKLYGVTPNPLHRLPMDVLDLVKASFLKVLIGKPFEDQPLTALNETILSCSEKMTGFMEDILTSPVLPSVVAKTEYRLVHSMLGWDKARTCCLHHLCSKLVINMSSIGQMPQLKNAARQTETIPYCLMDRLAAILETIPDDASANMPEFVHSHSNPFLDPQLAFELIMSNVTSPVVSTVVSTGSSVETEQLNLESSVTGTGGSF